MRRISSILLAGLMAALLCVPALAAGSAQLVRTFVTGTTLYTYVAMDGVDQPVTQAEAKIGGQSFPSAGKLETVQQAGFPVSYLLLVDNSTSMPKYRDLLVAFARQLAQSGGEHTTFLLATFGEKFSVVNEAVSADSLEQEMAAIPFDEPATRLHSCISQALDFFEDLPRQDNELRCMVVLSDAVEYDADGGVTYEELLERLGSSDVMLHSVGVGQQEAALTALGELASASGGTHQRAADETQAQEAAQALAAENGSMLVTGFDLTGCSASGEDQEVSVTFASNGALVCRAESTVDLPELEAEPETPDTSKPLPPSGVSAPSGAAGTAGGKEEEKALPLLPIVGIAGALVLAGVAAALCLRKKKPESSAPQPSEEGVFLRIEDLSGSLVGEETERWLTGQLMVGRDPACDIVLDDPSVSRRHARVFLAEGGVYLEDLGSQNGTMVNGAAIHMPCQLRSGDELAAGEARWKLKF